MYPMKMDEDFILRNLLSSEKTPFREEATYRQLSLFDAGQMLGPVPEKLKQTGLG